MRALIIEDQTLIVSGLRAVMTSLRAPPIELSEAASPEAARQALASGSRFDLVLLDLELEGSGGFDFLRELRSSHPATPIVVLSTSNAPDLVSRAIFAGAMGFVCKRASNATLVDALHLVLSGIVFVPPMTARSPSSGGSGAVESGTGWTVHRDTAADPPPPPTRMLATALGLTPRQTDVLELLMLGHPNKLIARALNLSVETVKDHVSPILRRLGVSSRTQVVLALARLADEVRQAPDAAPLRRLPRRFGDQVRSFAC